MSAGSQAGDPSDSSSILKSREQGWRSAGGQVSSMDTEGCLYSAFSLSFLFSGLKQVGTSSAVDERCVIWTGLLRRDTLLGVRAGMPDTRRFTGVGRAEGLLSLLATAEGVRRPAGGAAR